MHAIVAVKQAPDTTNVRINMETGTLIREGVPAILNPYDAHALEAALRLKEQHGGQVTVLSMGPAKASEALVECVEQGADRAILLTDRKFSGADTLATSYVLARAIEQLHAERAVDILLFGKQAIDGDTAQVGPGVATRLGLPLISYAVAIEQFDPVARTAIVHRKTEQGVEVLQTPLPVVLTCEKSISPLRHAPLPNLIRAARYKPDVWTASEPVTFDPTRIGLKGSPTVVGKAYTPPPTTPGEKLVITKRGLAHSVAYAIEKMRAARRQEPGDSHPLPNPTSPDLNPLSPWERDGVRVPSSERDGVRLPAPTSGGGASPTTARRIWVFIEQEEGRANPVAWELLGAARRLADQLGGASVEGVLLGHDVEPLAHAAFRYGAERIYLVDDPVLTLYRNLPYAVGAAQLAQTQRPDIFLIGATTVGRDLASSIATRVQTGLTADCTELAIDPEQSILAATRPTFGGNLMATILCKTARPQMATVRPRVLPLPEPTAEAGGEIIRVPLGLTEADVPVKRLRLIPATETLDIEYADVIVSGGRGMGGPEGVRLLEELAGQLGGVVGASRRVVDAGWLSADHLVGQTGRTVRPSVYIAAGISGAVQHRVGMAGSNFILAINSDPNAPIFQVADLGLVGDLYAVLPEMIRQIGPGAGGAKEAVWSTN